MNSLVFKYDEDIILKRIIFLIILFLLVFQSFAGFKSAVVNVSGLTCSACSYATQKSMLKLSFVKSVEMDLNSTLAYVYFKDSTTVDINALVQSVYDAGFSVSGVEVVFDFENSITFNSSGFLYEGKQYSFYESTSVPLLGEHKVLFVEKKMMSKSDFKKVKSVINEKQKENHSIYWIKILS